MSKPHLTRILIRETTTVFGRIELVINGKFVADVPVGKATEQPAEVLGLLSDIGYVYEEVSADAPSEDASAGGVVKPALYDAVANTANTRQAEADAAREKAIADQRATDASAVAELESGRQEKKDPVPDAETKRLDAAHVKNEAIIEAHAAGQPALGVTGNLVAATEQKANAAEAPKADAAKSATRVAAAKKPAAKADDKKG